MDDVRQSVVPAKLIRVGDYVPMGGWVVAKSESRIAGLFPKRYITLTFLMGQNLVNYTVESHIPVDIERIYEKVVDDKEKK